MVNFNKTTTTNLTSGVPNYTVAVKSTDGDYSNNENKWTNPDSAKNYGFYYRVGEYRAALNSYVRWVIGQGYKVGPIDKVILDNLSSWGEGTFMSILFNLLNVKKFDGDAYAEIITADGKSIDKGGDLVNLKTLNSSKMTHVTNKKGRLIRYEYAEGPDSIRKFKPTQIFHLCNDRILDEPHGTSVTSAVEWVIEKIQQVREDYSRLLHVSSVRIFYVDENDEERQNKIKTEYSDAIKNGEVMMLPCKPEDARFQDLEVPSADAWIRWQDNLEDKFYKQLGVPKVVLGGTAENTEASAKVGVIAYEPIWTMEIKELEADILNQLGINIKFNKQPSLMDNAQSDEAKNTGQTNIQPNDTTLTETTE